jgi:hypothetical protein
MGRRPLPRSPFLNRRFALAVEEFGHALKKTSDITNRGDKGEAREDALRDFFCKRLPTGFAVVKGEVVDLNGGVSPQLDIMFYDQSADFALNAEHTKILPAEALLASIEVKSKLNKVEIEKSIIAARSLRCLQPYGRPLGGVDVGDAPQKINIARYYHCLFAYDTDLSEDDWMSKEFARIVSLAGAGHLIDAVYVLNRGLLNIPGERGCMEDAEGGAITNFYFSILNFMQRESGRRKETPYYRYVTHANKSWLKLGRRKTN